jgi:hypothetical protein
VRDHDSSNGIRVALLATLRSFASTATAATWTTEAAQYANRPRRAFTR